ncbi:MAG: RNA pyrophosphohydrolase [Beijerinckiaceae bacterium]|nr:MAG: RNA pyrophosphohydrolase [Beijerinckiaceae bacterium]
MDDLSDYRPCAGVMLLNREGLVFIGRRITPAANHAPAHIWQMPQGGIDEGEDPYDAALRELREETNVVTTSLLGTAPDWYRYDVPGGMVRGHKVYKGQRQKWFALRFDGADNEIDIAHPAGDAHAEFDAWRWETLERLPELVVPFKRPIYERLVEVFRPLVEPQ